MSIGSNIKALRTMRNIKQKDMADALGFSCQNISKWENDVSLPDIETVVALAQYFNVSTDTLLGNVPKTVCETVKVTVNEKSHSCVWTDFQYSGTIAPPAFFNEGRRRADEKRPTRASAMGDCLMIGVNAEHKICFIKEIVDNRWHVRRQYWFYQRPRENLCVIRNENSSDKWYLKGEFELVLPPNGFMLVVELHDYATKQLLNFILPDELRSCIDNTKTLSERFYNNYNGSYLFTDMIGRGELDFIDVTLDGNTVKFSKQNNFSDPLSENIDRLTALVKQRVELSLKEIKDTVQSLQQQFNDAQCAADDATCQADDAMSMAEELESRIDELEAKINELSDN